MIQTLKKLVTSSLVLLGITGVLSLSFTPSAFALSAKDEVCDGLDESAGTTDCGSGTGRSVPELITSVISILMYVVGAVSVIMIIIGGVRYVLSNGDSNAVQGAKNTILYALIGLVIAIFAQVIVGFVINRA